MTRLHPVAMAALALAGVLLSADPRADAADLDQAPPPPPPQAQAAPASGPGACIDPRDLSDRMHGAGWYDVHQVQIRPDVVVLVGKQNKGLLYRLVIDRCSGDLIEARLLNGLEHGDAAYAGEEVDPVAAMAPLFYGLGYGYPPYGRRPGYY